jgi:RNA polymerase sigma-B factor
VSALADDERADAVQARFVEFHETRDRELRNQLVVEHRHLAEYFVKRYSHRGVSPDDLRQLALMSIVHAVDRFDPAMGVAFSTFASRTIEGELKRYFRDRTWSVRPPRRAQELHLEIRQAEEDLSHRLGRSPTVSELAAALAVDEDHVLEAMEAGRAHQAASLDQRVDQDDDRSSTTADRVLAETEPGYVEIDRQLIVRELMEELPERERTIVYMRFFENMTQPEIADKVGVSQSYLSRILRKALLDLRARLTD